MLLCDITLWC